MGTAIKHPAPGRVINPAWRRMLYSCTHMATVGVKGLKCISKYPCSFHDPSQVPNALHQQSLTHSEDVDEFWNKTMGVQLARLSCVWYTNDEHLRVAGKSSNVRRTTDLWRRWQWHVPTRTDELPLQ